MDMRKRRDAQLAYISDESVFEEQVVCRRILQKLNFMDRADFDGIAEVVKELLGKSDNAFINPPFYCDYGKNIETGKNFFANYNCTILDVAMVRIGDNCQFAPNVAIYTVCPGVHIGNNVVIGAGSVVTRDIPDWSVAAGNPCRVIRKITEEDRRKLFRNEEIDEEAWEDILSRIQDEK